MNLFVELIIVRFGESCNYKKQEHFKCGYNVLQMLLLQLRCV